MDRHTRDGVAVGRIVLDELVRANVPELDGVVGTAGRDAAAVFVKHHTVHHAAGRDKQHE
jgi:hypothetical protein